MRNWGPKIADLGGSNAVRENTDLGGGNGGREIADLAERCERR